MKMNWIKKPLSLVIAGAMVFCLVAAAGKPAALYAEEAEGGKYVSEVFIAYGKTEKEAAKWLTDNGWEPVEGDFNAGKASFFDDNKIQDQNVAAVMGIRRTDDKEDAITDMAVMNMKGGYSVPDYESLLKDKKGEIREFINNFMVVIEEYRANLSGEGSEFGGERAQLAHDMLNKFYDGEVDGEYAINDTGLKLGDLLAQETRQEGNKEGGDLEQIILESSGPAIIAVETFLALGADSGEETWIERAGGLTGEELAKNLPKYAPEAEEQDVAPSAISQFLGQKYGDTAKLLAEQWTNVHNEMLWFEETNELNGLWPEDGEDEESYNARIEDYFKALIEEDETEGTFQQNRYMTARILYNSLYESPYVGDWGETMGDFFNPADGTDYSTDADNFLPMAAALSPGQRASLDLLSLSALLQIGFGSTEGLERALPDIDEIFGDNLELSVYTGVNRAAFRGGVALTSAALMEENAGRGSAYNKLWDNTGIVAISSYAAAAVSVPMIIAGGVMAAKGIQYIGLTPKRVASLKSQINKCKLLIENYRAEDNFERVTYYTEHMKGYQKTLDSHTYLTKPGVAGRVIQGVGGVLLIGAAIVKGVQLYKYYERDMLPIPRMIVDESDIVTYLEDENGKPILDENGKQKKNIEFNTYEYYTSVKCNRPEVGEIGDWQSGVEEYKDHNCFDVADLNADMGQEWIAMYTVKSKSKGDPVLADSLTMQYGKKDTPEGCTQKLHLFTYTNAVDLGDTAWAFNNDKKGVYFFWDVDENAFAEEAASAFSGGQLALAGIGGLMLGILGSTVVLTKKRRKDEHEAA